MHMSKGYTYMLSILQFLNTLADFVKVELLCLDSRNAIEDYLNSSLGLSLHKNLEVIQISNRKFGVKSNKLFFRRNFLNYVGKNYEEGLVIYTRDLKQMRIALKNIKKSYPSVRFVLELHQILSQNFCRDGNYHKAKEMQKLEEYVLSNIDDLICITSTLSNEVNKNFPKSTKNQHILPVGFNKDFLKIEHENSKSYDIVYTGSFSSWKGLDTLISALSIIKREYKKDIRAVLIGADKKTRIKYSKIVNSNDLTDNITIKDKIAHKEIFQFISKSKVGVLSNNYQGDAIFFTSPLKLYEYLGAGLKVVVSRLPSIESAIDPSLVYYATPENPDSFAIEIMRALNDSSFKMQKVKDFAKEFTWEKRAQEFLSILS